MCLGAMKHIWGCPPPIYSLCSISNSNHCTGAMETQDLRRSEGAHSCISGQTGFANASLFSIELNPVFWVEVGVGL